MSQKPRFPAPEVAAAGPAAGYDYAVGYCRPPKHSQFKPGQSGNPKGRPRRQRNLRTVVEETLKETVTIREGARERKVSRLDAIVRVTVTNALKGDIKSLAALIQLLRPTGLLGEQPETTARDLTPEDEAIIADFLRRQGLAEAPVPSAAIAPAQTDIGGDAAPRHRGHSGAQTRQGETGR